jgi:hypothetical protein
MNDTVNLSYRYSERDIVRAMRSHYALHMRPRLDIFATIVLAAVGAYLWRAPDSHWFGVSLVGVSAAFSLLLLAAFVVIPPLAYRLNPKYHDDYSLTFSSEGIHFRTVHVDSQLQWSLYSRVVVNANSYILYYGSRTFTVIPKRVFENSEQETAFKGLLAEHVSKIVTRS